MATTVIAIAGDAAIRPQASVNIVDGDRSAVITGRADPIGLAGGAARCSTAKARQPERWSL
ncbi:hypothetical protein A5673_02580 [Mycobacterium sp. E3198]|nr:hypothetical protein A5673_02580 [Mycobacterium sp. E3198]